MLQAEQEEQTKIEYQSVKGLAMERKKRRVPRQSRGGGNEGGVGVQKPNDRANSMLQI